MDSLLNTELLKNAEALLKLPMDFSGSYLAAKINAISVFKNLGLPSKKDEDWKYTNIQKHLSARYLLKNENQSFDLTSEQLDLILDQRGFIVFNNGVFNKFISILPEGLELDSLSHNENYLDTFDALNFGVCLSPLFLKLTKNTSIDFPITILHLMDDLSINKMTSPRLTILAEENSKASLVEIFHSTKTDGRQYTTNAVTKFNLLANAHIEYLKIVTDAKSAVHIGLTEAKIYKNAFFQSIILDFGMLTTRHNLNLQLMEAGAHTNAHGLYLLQNNEHADIFSNIKHLAPHTTSEQLFKGILGGNSRGAFTGKIIVEKDAQQSNSSQLNKNLLLSKTAHAYTRPQLLVGADDVKCTHGATVGQLSKEEEFYLESRGISLERARQMLCFGFALDVLLKIEHPSLKEFAKNILNQHFLKLMANL